MTGWYIFTPLLSFFLAVIITPLMRRYAERRKIIDDPAVDPARKRHHRPIALLGGLALISATLMTWWVLELWGVMSNEIFPRKYLIGLTVAGLLIAVGGYGDDRWHWTPGRQLLWPLLASTAVVLVGIGIPYISNPFGGVLYLNHIQWTVFNWNNLPYHLTLWADLFALLWLMGAMYTTKILDGLDGLVSGVGLIGSVVIFLLTLRPEVSQSSVGLIALSLAGAAAGFLIFNWHPAKIFLGESGALFIGLMLGVLAIISGGKIATALLILGLPILDLIWVMIRRVFSGGGRRVWLADRSHLHFRLLDAGLSVRQAVSLLYAITIVFGLSTLWVTGKTKVFVLIGLTVCSIGLISWAVYKLRQRDKIRASTI